MRRAIIAALMTAGALACSNSGENRFLSVSTTGVVKGLVFFDKDGDLALGAADDSVHGIKVQLVTLNGSDTVATATTPLSGQYRIANVPVGTYKVVLDKTTLIDTAVIALQDSAQVTVLPNDSAVVVIGIGYPHVSIRVARTTVPLGHRVFITGIILNSPSTFSDTTMHVQDTSAAIRMTRVVATPAAAADSVRVRGTVSTRDGQRTLDVVTTFVVAPSFLPSATTVTTGVAKIAANGSLDAQQVQILLATVTDTSRDTEGFHLTVNDSSGALDVLLDPLQFPPSVLPPVASSPYIPGSKFRIVGLVVPTAAAGIWRVKPRSQAELIKLP
jgi:hypothetical protein